MNMKNIVNIVIRMVIIIGAAWLFPEYVKVQDIRTVALIVVTILIVSNAIGFITIGIIFLANISRNETLIWITMIIAMIMALISGIIQLVVAAHFVPGFEINGKATYIILALMISVFSLEKKEEARNRADAT